MRFNNHHDFNIPNEFEVSRLIRKTGVQILAKSGSNLRPIVRVEKVLEM